MQQTAIIYLPEAPAALMALFPYKAKNNVYYSDIVCFTLMLHIAVEEAMMHVTHAFKHLSPLTFLS